MWCGLLVGAVSNTERSGTLSAALSYTAWCFALMGCVAMHF
jgi:hypothetical protein